MLRGRWRPNADHRRPLRTPGAALCLCFVGFAASAAATAAGGPAAGPPRVFIQTFEHDEDLALRKQLMRELKRSKSLRLVKTPSDADYVLNGAAERYVRGYYSLYVRAGSSPNRGTPLYAGYVSVELTDSGGRTVWSYLASLHNATSEPNRLLARDLVRHLVTASPLRSLPSSP